MLDLRDNIPKTHALVVAEFATLHEKLLKIGARVVETASRIRLTPATAVSTRRPVPASGRRLAARGTLNGGARDNVRAPHSPIPETPTRSKSTDRPSGKNAMPNCAQNQTAHKTINARQLGE